MNEIVSQFEILSRNLPGGNIQEFAWRDYPGICLEGLSRNLPGGNIQEFASGNYPGICLEGLNIRGETDKSLALQRKQQATGLQKCIYSTYSPLSSTHL
jgi:hypothetical protein